MNLTYCYDPSNILLKGIRNLFPLEICPWDEYYMAMAATDFKCGRHKAKASKTFFIRKPPFGGSYALLGGLTAFLRTLNDYSFANEEVQNALKDTGYEKDFIKYLANELVRVNVSVFAPPEGSVILPNEPAVILEGDLISVRIAEGMLLKQVNYPTLALTKWHRCALAADPGLLFEFARRRSQDDLRTTLYAHLGGASFTSNTEIRRGLNIPSRGTMGHEFIQSFGDEYKAFDAWLEHNPHKPILLVDTIDTLHSGIPNAIKVFTKHAGRMNNAGGRPGIRLDSGDLAYLAIEARMALDSKDLTKCQIYMTNDLDEYSITDIKNQIRTNFPQNADRVLSTLVWAAGTRPGTCYDQPSLGGVAKLSSMCFNGDCEKAVIKLARDNPVKTSIPGSNRSCYIWDDTTHELLCCLIYHKSEDVRDIEKCYHPDDEDKVLEINRNHRIVANRQRLQFSDGKIINPDILIQDVKDQIMLDTKSLHWTHKRLMNPHTIKVSLSPEVFHLRQSMIKTQQLME